MIDVLASLGILLVIIPHSSEVFNSATMGWVCKVSVWVFWESCLNQDFQDLSESRIIADYTDYADYVSELLMYLV